MAILVIIVGAILLCKGLHRIGLFHVLLRLVNGTDVHSVESDIRKWSHEFLEVPNEKLNGLPPCPYAKQAWADDKVTFSVNTGLEGLIESVRDFDKHDYDIVVWASEELPDMQYLDGLCDGINELMSIAGMDMHLMVFHPDYDADKAGLDFLVADNVVDESLEYCMVFVQRLSVLDDAALSLEKSGYYLHFPVDVFQSLVTDRRRLRNEGQN
tara:strand:+ start:1412 stop:2047 length:636 start_codon:yes stop_codon:yes gene_type:complete